MDKQFNPWLKIDWDNTLADKDVLTQLKKSSLLQLDTLPEPYTGDLESEVYCLSMNPGEKDSLFELSDYNRHLLLEYTQKTLAHEIKDNMWFHLNEHNGYYWWRKITSELRKELKRNPKMFTIEFFPYHSKRGFSYPAPLHSYNYSNWLIENAIKQNKYILILRHKKEWLNRISNLEHYQKLFFIDPQKARNLLISKLCIKKGQNCSCELDELIKHF